MLAISTTHGRPRFTLSVPGEPPVEVDAPAGVALLSAPVNFGSLRWWLTGPLTRDGAVITDGLVVSLLDFDWNLVA